MAEAGLRAMPVAGAQPAFEKVGTVALIVTRPCSGPLAKAGMRQSLGVAVDARCMGGVCEGDAYRDGG